MFREVINAAQTVQRSIEENMRDRAGQSMSEEIIQPILQESQSLQQAGETFQREKSTVEGMLNTIRVMI